MILNPSSNGAWDLPFIALQLAILLFWIGSHIALHDLPQGWRLMTWGIAALALVAAPLGWMLLYPPANGIDGAGRLLVLGASLPPNGLGLATLIWRLHRRAALPREGEVAHTPTSP